MSHGTAIHLGQWRRWGMGFALGGRATMLAVILGLVAVTGLAADTSWAQRAGKGPAGEVRPRPLRPGRLALDAALSLDTPRLHKIADGTVHVELRVSNAANLGAFEVDLDYSDKLVRLNGVTLSSFLGQKGAGCNPATQRCQVQLGPLVLSGLTGIGAYTYGTGSGAEGAGSLATLAFEPTGASGRVTVEAINPQLSDVNGTMLPSTATGTWFEVGTPGNCNDDSWVDAGDVSATILEIFDGDGSAPLDTRGGIFNGSPVGCNSNEDSSVDAGDLSCTILLIFRGPGACGG